MRIRRIHVFLLFACLSVLAHAPLGAQALLAHFPLKTRWARDVSPEHVLPEYPRPDMVRRRWQNLNGRWEYAIRDSGGKAPGQYDGTVLVPFPVESQLSGVERVVTPVQRLWYRRPFRKPRLVAGERLLLHFGAVDWEAVVFVNGHEVGRHTGGYDPFSVDITDALREHPEQELVVRVWDPTEEGGQPCGKQFLDTTARGILYTPVTGIWQTVWLEPVPQASIRALTIIPDVDGSRVRVWALATGAVPGDRVRIAVLDGNRSVGVAAGRAGDTITVPVPHPHLWSPSDPFLYTLRIDLASGDRVRSYVGMRKIQVSRDNAGFKRLFLNGKPLFQVGALDQGYWPDGLYTAPTDAALRSDIEQAKRLGLNMVRKHVKVEPDRWYYHADRLGLLVWQDMPMALKNNATPEIRANFRDELRHVVDAFRNHPAIVMWVPFNEGNGQYEPNWYATWLRQYDPTRIANVASGANIAGQDADSSDVIDYHTYPDPKMPPPDPHRAAVLGEYGGVALALPGHLWQRHTFGNTGYEMTLEQFGDGYRRMMQKVKSLRDQGLAAVVYTQLTDVEGEVNGLMTYDRAIIKIPPDAVRENVQLYETAPLKGTK